MLSIVGGGKLGWDTAVSTGLEVERGKLESISITITECSIVVSEVSKRPKESVLSIVVSEWDGAEASFSTVLQLAAVDVAIVASAVRDHRRGF